MVKIKKAKCSNLPTTITHTAVAFWVSQSVREREREWVRNKDSKTDRESDWKIVEQGNLIKKQIYIYIYIYIFGKSSCCCCCGFSCSYSQLFLCLPSVTNLLLLLLLFIQSSNNLLTTSITTTTLIFHNIHFCCYIFVLFVSINLPTDQTKFLTELTFASYSTHFSSVLFTFVRHFFEVKQTTHGSIWELQC